MFKHETIKKINLNEIDFVTVNKHDLTIENKYSKIILPYPSRYDLLIDATTIAIDKKTIKMKVNS